MDRQDVTAGIREIRTVSGESREFLRQKSRIEDVRRGQLLYRAKEPADNVYIQLKGKSMLYNLTGDGSRKIIFILGPGELLNDHMLNEKCASLFCEVIEDGQVLRIPAADFLAQMEKDFSLTRWVLSAQERKLWRMGHQLKNTMGSIYLERKLAAKLWKLARDFGIPTEKGVEIDVRMPVTILADLLGAPRETTSRVCRTLTERGLILMEKKRILIPDPDRLAEFYRSRKLPPKVSDDIGEKTIQ